MTLKLGLRSAGIDFMAGLLSKAIATVLCYPLIYIKYNQQASKGDTKQSALEIAVQTYHNYGCAKFYSGLRTKLVQSSLSNALTFMIKEKVVLYTFAMMLYIVEKRQQVRGMKVAAQKQ